MMEQLLADIRHAISTRPLLATTQCDQLDATLRTALAAPDAIGRAYDAATILPVVQAIHRHAVAFELSPEEAISQAAMVAVDWIDAASA